jgi:hypothetical protein
VTSFIYKLSKVPVIHTKTKMVCLNCKERIINLSRIALFIDILEYCDLKTIYISAQTNSHVYRAAIYFFTKFIKIKNTRVEKLSRWEINMMLLSANYFDGHNIWKKQHIKILMMNYYTGSNLYLPLTNNTNNIECNILYCDNLCTKKLQNINGQSKYTILDLFDMLLFITKMENKNTGVRNTIWHKDNVDIKIKLALFFDNVYIDNDKILIALIPLFTKIFIAFIDNLSLEMYTSDTNNKSLVTKFLSIMTKTEELTSRFLVEIEKNISNPHTHHKKEKIQTNFHTIKNIIKSHIKNVCKTHNHERKSVVSHMISVLNKIFNYPIYRWENYLNEIQSLLPISYPFDFTYKIIKINKFINMDGFENLIQFGMLGNRCINVEISNGIDTKHQYIVFKGCTQEEYYNYLLIKILYSLNNYDYPINDIYQITDNIFIIQIENNIVPICSIYNKELSIRDYVYSKNLSAQLSTILENYSNSLAILYCIVCLFNIDINNHEQVVLNESGQIYISRFSYDQKQFEYKQTILPLTDLLGSMNSKIFKDFKIKTINTYKVLKNYRFIISNILNVLLKCDDFHIDDNIIDINGFFL